MGAGVKRSLAIVVALVVFFAALTYAALELGGVAIIETQREDGTTRTTHVWYVQQRSDIWLEAGAPTNGWFVDIQRTGELQLTLGTNPFPYRTVVVAKPDVRDRVRALLREKYGWRDLWVGLFVDQESATPVRLVPGKADRGSMPSPTNATNATNATNPPTPPDPPSATGPS